MSLEQYKENLNNHIEKQEEVLEQLAAQIQQLQMELRWDKKKLNDQTQIQKEIDKWLKHGKKLLEDACGAFPREAMKDIVDEVDKIATEVVEKYDDLEQQYTYLMREVDQPPTIKAIESGRKEEEEETSGGVVIEIEPDENPDGTLTAKGAERQIEDLEHEVQQKIASMIGTRATKPNTIGKAIADNNMTRQDLDKMIDAAKMLSKNTIFLKAS